MTAPGPPPLGRSVVVGPGAPSPDAWAGAGRVIVGPEAIADPEALTQLVLTTGRLYVTRQPVVYELLVDPSTLSQIETDERPPYELGARFSFLFERLQKTVWHNSYDARNGDLIWWWAHKAAARLNVDVSGPADVIGREGRAWWVDGGPRQPLDIADSVVHHESVDLGVLKPVPRPGVVPEDDLAEDQLRAVTHPAGPARVLAPAGSGKTRVLTERVRYLLDGLEVEPDIVTALAYNRRAADEMRERLPGSGADLRTIHSLGWEVLRETRPGVRLIDERDQRQLVAPLAPAPPRVNTDVIGPYLEALDEVRVGLRSPDVVEASRDDVPGFAEVFDRYRGALLRRNEADHAEQVYGAVEGLARDPALRARWQMKCRHLLVDEFQDLTPAYLLMVRMLAGPGLDVFGVGDDDQVIYGYSGADPGFLLDYEELFPGAGSHLLGVNYRCPRDVVEGAVNLLTYNRRRVEKEIRAATEGTGMEIVSGEGPRLAESAVGHVEGLLGEGAQPASVAILSRVNSTLLPVHVALAGRGIPFSSGLNASILQRTVIRAALAWIRLALDPGAMSRDDLFEAVRRPQRGITRLLTERLGSRRGPFTLEQLIDAGRDLDGRRADRWDGFCQDILDASRSTGDCVTLMRALISKVGLDRAAASLDAGRTRADRSSQTDDLTALERVVRLAPSEPALLESWLREQLSAPTSDDGVVLSTVHRVKGLEWDHVIVFGADKGTMPHQLSTDIEEERRVFHVAITRGRRSVTVFADEAVPSRFLTELDGSAPHPTAEDELLEVGTAAPRDGVFVVVGDQIGLSGGYLGVVDEVLTTGVLVTLVATGASMAVPWGERVTKGGDSGRLAPGRGSPSSEVIAKLKEWRREVSQAQGVPAYVVFNDKTLEALAALRPTTPEALLTVPGIGPAKLDSYGDDLLDLLG